MVGALIIPLSRDSNEVAAIDSGSGSCVTTDATTALNMALFLLCHVTTSAINLVDGSDVHHWDHPQRRQYGFYLIM